MATAQQVIKAALQKILVQASESDLEASEYSDAIVTLNNMMLSLDAEGINLGYTEVTSLGDEITIPQGALRGTIYNLALELAPEYGGEVTPAAASIAAQGMKAMEMIGVSVPVSSLPCTLPIGHGNEGHDSGNIEKFYPASEDAILSETTGAIGLESGTVSS